MLNYFLRYSGNSLPKFGFGALSVVFAALIFFAAEKSVEAVADVAAENESVASLSIDSQKRLNRADIQKNKLQNQYNVLASTINSCSLAKVVTEPTVRKILSPAGNLCVNGALAVSDSTFNRPLASSTGTGIGNGTAGNCSLSGTATASHYDAYNFTLTGCAAFPTEITATLCGPAGCQHLGNVDTTLLLYRNVAAGDPFTGNGGLPGVFNPASPCTNARGGQDDLGTTVGTPNNPGGATCNQTIGANCVAPCTSPSNAGGLSGFRRSLGSGNFTLVVDGFGNTTVGNYNLYVDAPATGCTVALVPTAARVSISGKVLTPQSSGLGNALVTLTASNGTSQTILTRNSGDFQFTELNAGETYVISINSKRYRFTPRVIASTEDLTGLYLMVNP